MNPLPHLPICTSFGVPQIRSVYPSQASPCLHCLRYTQLLPLNRLIQFVEKWINILRESKTSILCATIWSKQAIHGRGFELIREEKLLQLFLWKIVHFALFFVQISINFSPSYSTVFSPITVDISTLQKFQNFCTMF
jgi:hypothetical protein